MTVLVFVGPTLAGEALPEGFEARPPAAAGKMLEQAPAQPATLGLIDGLFGRVRSPWHKELLHLMAAGHRLIGAASMGMLPTRPPRSAGSRSRSRSSTCGPLPPALAAPGCLRRCRASSGS
ncbi:MAG: TfuA-like protein [Thermaurantiacus tibetensis]|uniref:TfuA-like protein n=1 Tax=Thermaurantiacus tibetensis TaxID=2759035 RepID=UPI0018903397|nr:TfuA-like protein [Thermaurantiacus tibetensis]